MRYSQGLETKLFPWDESLRVPFLLRWPSLRNNTGAKLAIPIDAPDVMPTLLGLCEMPVPETVEGRDWSPELRGDKALTGEEAAFLNMPAEFTELRSNGMKAYRGLRTARYTYVRTTDGPWLLYDNEADPFQMKNRIDDPTHAALRENLEAQLQKRLVDRKDEFKAGSYYLERDHLTHYQEVNNPNARTWKDPWKPD
jgi:arylsulfatase A-like enzyme